MILGLLKKYVCFKSSTVIAFKTVMTLAVTMFDVPIAPFTKGETNLSMIASKSLWTSAKFFGPLYDLSEVSDDQIDYGRDLRRTRKRCGFDCARLQVPSLIDELSQHIAANLIRAGFHAFSYSNNSRHVFKEEISAVSLYIASHLVGRLVSRRAIQEIMGEARYPDIRSTCRVVRNACN